MAVSKNFVVKNGLEVAGDLIFANDANNTIGIGTTNVLYTMHVVGGIGATDIVVTGVSTFATALIDSSTIASASISQIVLDGPVGVSATNYTGREGQYLKSTGTAVQWEDFPSTGRQAYSYTATPGQTVFNVAYSVGLVDIFVNGVKLSPSEFIANDAVSITVLDPCFGGETVDILAYSVQGLGVGNSGINGITIQDESITIGNPQGVTSLNFVGSAVTAVASGAGVTITVFGGGGGSGFFESTSAGIHTITNVGIATTNPTSALTVAGSGITATQLFVSGISTLGGIDVLRNNGINMGSSANPTTGEIRIYNGVSPTDYFQIYATANDGFIRNVGGFANDISVSSYNNVTIGGGGTHTYSIVANSDGSAGLAYSSAERLRTLGVGVTVTGTTFTNQLSVSGVSTFSGTNSTQVHLGNTGYYAGITWSGVGGVYGGTEPSILTNSGLGLDISGGLGNILLSAPTIGAEVTIRAGNLAPTAINCVGNAQVELYNNGDKKFETIGTGVTVIGDFYVSGNAIDLSVSGNLQADTATITGIITATGFVGDGSGLTGVTAVGSGVVIQEEGSTVGTSSTINFIGAGVTAVIVGGVANVTVADAGTVGYFNNIQTNPGIHTTASYVGLGTTNPQTPLQIENVYGVKTGSGTFTAAAGIAYTANTYATSDFTNAEYTLFFQHSSGIQSQKVLVMDDGSTAYSQEYGIMYSSDLLVSVGATVKSGNVELWWTPETGITGIVTYRYIRETML